MKVNGQILPNPISQAFLSSFSLPIPSLFPFFTCFYVAFIAQILFGRLFAAENSWLIKSPQHVTAIALRNTFPEFLSDSSQESIFKKFLVERIDLDRAEGLRLVP